MDFTTSNLYSMNGIGNGTGFSPVSIPFFDDSNSASAFSNPLATANEFPGFNNDFMSTMTMFNSFMNNLMPMSWQNKFFTEHFNTNTNLPQLKNVHYNPNLGNSLANIAYKNASEKNTRHKCLQGVRETLNKADLVNGKMGASAYQAGEVLDHNKNFREVSVDTKDLKNLPAGCIIVWAKNGFGTKSSDIHGHIAVTLGNGREASDHVSNKTYILNSSHRVFVPVGMNKSA